jgi:hypothetical protein
MRARRILFGIAAAGLLVGGLRVAAAQDPAAVNAKSIKVKFENDKVRVLEGSIAPGMKEEMHSHPGYVIYVIDGGKMRDPITHWAENIGTTTIHLILVELKEAELKKPS